MREEGIDDDKCDCSGGCRRYLSRSINLSFLKILDGVLISEVTW